MKPEITLRLAKHRGRDFIAGFPWLFRGDFIESSEQLLCHAGCLADVTDARGQFLARGTFHAHSPIPFRELSRKQEPIDEAFFTRRLRTALERRQKLFAAPYYRLVHSEGDHLAGLVIDRFDSLYSCQISTAGMEQLWPLAQAALQALLSPTALALRNDIPARSRERLEQGVRVITGAIPPVVEVIENNCRYLADLIKGQKTGWFYDQRDNRAFIASLAEDKTLLDAYSHSGGFGLLAAKSGAARVTCLDSSATALELAQKAAELNGVSERCRFLRGDAMESCAELLKQGEYFDIVTLDPPAFVKSPKDIIPGLKAYAKIAQLGAALVKPEGVLYVASCSHRASRPAFEKAVAEGIAKASRSGTVIKRMGAAGDHPIHPKLQQNEYLKSTTWRIDP